MCDQCKKLICDPNCPNFDVLEKDSSKVRCVLCGETALAGVDFYAMHGFPYCEACLDAADAETFVRICEIPKREWLKKMGFFLMEQNG